MRFTIRRKLALGFACLLVLMGTVAAISRTALVSLRNSAHDAVNVGGRLNAVALEIQVHNLEVQRKTRAYFDQAPKIGREEARQQYLEEADFELSEIRSLVQTAIRVAPGADARARFEKISAALADYEQRRTEAVATFDADAKGDRTERAMAAYGDAGNRLHDTAEDGEVTGRTASESAQEDIERTSSRASQESVAIAMLGLLLALAASMLLARAILRPIDHLKDIAENVSMGNLDLEVKQHSDDEIGDLSESFARMLTAVKFFRMESQLAEAGKEAA